MLAWELQISGEETVLEGMQRFNKDLVIILKAMTSHLQISAIIIKKVV